MSPKGLLNEFRSRLSLNKTRETKGTISKFTRKIASFTFKRKNRGAAGGSDSSARRRGHVLRGTPNVQALGNSSEAEHIAQDQKGPKQKSSNSKDTKKPQKDGKKPPKKA